MRSRLRRAYVAVVVLGMGGYLAAGPGTSCSSFFGESSLTDADACFIFDCQNGILGGTFDPCAGFNGSGGTFESSSSLNPDQREGTFGQGTLPLFRDCPI